ncbi:MAG: ATP-binding protein, partial [bacterium]
ILEVRDNGPGISKDQHEKIFERFYRGGAGRESQNSGAGLGLAIARWAVEVNHGRIELESEPRRGSTFRIVLPVQNQEGG